MAAKNLNEMSISEIASVITTSWLKPYFGAVPHLEAMRTMNKISDKYGCNDGKHIVLYFLSNAGTWRGGLAPVVKAELTRRLRGAA